MTNSHSAPLVIPEVTKTNPERRIGFRAALAFWLKLGFISFGGPAGQIGIMHQELVERRRWISEHRFLNALNFTMLLPGPEAQQLATYIGWLFHGTVGGIVAGLLFILPSLLILILLTTVYLLFGETGLVTGVLYGVKPAVTAIVLFAAYRIGSRAIKNNFLWGVAGAAFVAIFFLNVPFPYIVLGAGLVGLAGSRLKPDYFKTTSVESISTDGENGQPFVIDDATPLPAHARFSWPRTALVTFVMLALWAGVMASLNGVYGWEGNLTQMGWFFTKAALLTFGGAYAVLPYVYQGAVEHYQWLTATQMIDGLALGETTPGPLIMIVTFVGFVGGWSKEILDANLFLAGLSGAVVATFFTFLPSFFFILAGAPIIEATRHNISFSAPLTAITAAVVGVIVNLALFFAYHVLWPAGFEGPFDFFSALLGMAAFVALIRFKAGIMPLIGVCAAIGVVHQFAGMYLST